MGEEICAWVQLRDGQTLIADDVKSFCKGQITHFKIPKHIRFVDDYPMTVTGKIQKFKMSEMMSDMLSSG
jgi:fatty-acyl-CoA synthase